MWGMIEYITAGAKVTYDKVYDYAAYYTGYIEYEENEEKNDNIDDYESLIDVEKYTDEKKNKRVFKRIGLLREYIVFLGSPTHIIDNLYLGSAFNAATYKTLKELDIRIIINMTKEIRQYYPEDFKYIQYELYDNNKNSIGKYLKKAYKDIKKYQDESEGNILIHCYMGASRSASVVIYYLMKTEEYTFDEALEYIKNKRSNVNPTFRMTKDLASSMRV